jgi:hypothetical protein
MTSLIFDGDDEVRISASRNRATATLSTEELSQGLSVCGSPLILAEKCEGGARYRRST